MPINTTLPQAGINFLVAYTAATTASSTSGLDQPSPPWLPGTIEFGSNGSQWLFCKAGGTIAAGDFVVTTTQATFVVSALTSTNGRANFGSMVGCAGADATVDQFLWVCTRGYLPLASLEGGASPNVLTGSVANVALHTTATAGRIDDSGSANTTATISPVIGTDTAASNTSPVYLQNPTVTALD